MATKKKKPQTLARSRRGWAIVMANGQMDEIAFSRKYLTTLDGERIARVQIIEVPKTDTIVRIKSRRYQ